MTHECGLVWFRNDLRLDDNPAFAAACKECKHVVPVHIWFPEGDGAWAPGAATHWWLRKSLTALDEQLTHHRSRLLCKTGSPGKVLADIIRESAATAVYWNRRYEPSAFAQDADVEATLRKSGLTVNTYSATLVVEPWAVSTRQNTPYKVFTPFWRNAVSVADVPAPLPEPRRIPGLPDGLAFDRSSPDIRRKGSASPAAGDSRPPNCGEDDGSDSSGVTASFGRAWTPGSGGGRKALDRFLNEALADYAKHRDRPDLTGVSRLSPYLHFGEVSVRSVWRAVREAGALDDQPGVVEGSEAFLRQLAWREFAYHLLHHYPGTPEQPLHSAFARFPWKEDSGGLAAWKEGRTGYPFVDAAMRELAATGWIHNRTRMVAASFLVKHLLIPWQTGARWFWERLVDADLANNTLGWQWVAGCGADAAPYFRVFNPTLQGEKFDPNGDYARRWIPELADVPARWVHRPWNVPNLAYPARIVEHDLARRQALQAYSMIRGTR